MKNTVNISNNLDVIPNTNVIFQTATEKLRCCLTVSTMSYKTSQKDSVQMKKFIPSVIQNGSLTHLSGAAIINNKPALFIHKYHCNKGLSKL